MDNGQETIGQDKELSQRPIKNKDVNKDDFVLEKSIFNNVFEKDIRRVFIFKKAERLAKALHLIAPAFTGSPSLRNRVDAIGIGLVDAAIVPSEAARTALARELLALSSVLSIARVGGLLSAMNAELISHEAQILLQEVAEYEEPRLFLDVAPSLAEIAKNVAKNEDSVTQFVPRSSRPSTQTKAPKSARKGHIKDTRPAAGVEDRRSAILDVIQQKGSASIKDISTVIRSVSEKTIQRELAALIALGQVAKAGERRWSTYSII